MKRIKQWWLGYKLRRSQGTAYRLNQPDNQPLDPEIYTKELDEIMDKIYDLAYDHISERSIAIGTDRIKQAILDWHNKQTLELLDRLESQVRRADDCTEDTFVVKAIRIEAERNKLKEQTNDQLYEKLDKILNWQQRMFLVEALIQDISNTHKLEITDDIMNKYRDEAKQAITSLIKELIEEVIKKPHILPKNAQHLESVKHGINFYRRQMRKRVDKLKEQL